MPKQTPLYQQHVDMGGKMVDFGGWEMPINYGSQIEEHHHVRHDAGMFDVSHMTVVDLRGEKVIPFIAKLLANDVSKILGKPGKALYSCMLNEQGGVIDDLIIYFMQDDWIRMVVNASTREKDLAWISEQAQSFDVSVTEKDDVAMIAVQGPMAREKAAKAIGPRLTGADKLTPFFAIDLSDDKGELFVARTGYTGEDGYEIMCPAEQAASIWQALSEVGVFPAGLGARDTLRLEAGMNLYGNDMDEKTTPFQAGLGWTVDLKDENRDFIGRSALVAQKESGIPDKLVGLVLQDKGVLRSHQKVIVEGAGEGEITSGSFSPTLGKSIAFARVPRDIGDSCQVEVRNKLLNCVVVKAPFARNGNACL